MLLTYNIAGSRGSFASTPAKPLLTPNLESEGQSFDTMEMSVEYFFASDARYAELNVSVYQCINEYQFITFKGSLNLQANVSYAYFCQRYLLLVVKNN